jgi:hypothetical protein
MSLAKTVHATLFAGLRGLGFGSLGSSALTQCYGFKLMVRSTTLHAEKKLPLLFFLGEALFMA